MVTIITNFRVQSVNEQSTVSNIANKMKGEYSPSNELFDLLVTNPILVTEKKDTPCIIFSKFKDMSGSRCIANVSEIDTNYFGLDFDDDITIDQFTEKYKQYQFWLYTSSSHTEEHHKFRVIFKGSNLQYDFIEPIKRRAFKLAIKKYFGPVDDKALGPERILALPRITPNYQYIINNGIDLNLSQWRFDDAYKTIMNEITVEADKRVKKAAKLPKTELENDPVKHAKILWDKYYDHKMVQGQGYDTVKDYCIYCGKKQIDWYIVLDNIMATGKIKQFEISNYKGAWETGTRSH